MISPVSNDECRAYIYQRSNSKPVGKPKGLRHCDSNITSQPYYEPSNREKQADDDHKLHSVFRCHTYDD